MIRNRGLCPLFLLPPAYAFLITLSLFMQLIVEKTPTWPIKAKINPLFAKEIGAFVDTHKVIPKYPAKTFTSLM